MNEEEQKAIEDLRGYLEWNDKNSFSRLPRDNHIEILLNLISKLQKEIEEQDETIEKSVKEQKEREKYTHNLEKVIDLMAKERAKISDEIPVPAEAIKNFYFKKVEEENE